MARRSSCVVFFQAEVGIRNIGVTGVQTCALPISQHAPLNVAPKLDAALRQLPGSPTIDRGVDDAANGATDVDGGARRSEERRVGQDGSSRWSPRHYKKK